MSDTGLNTPARRDESTAEAAAERPIDRDAVFRLLAEKRRRHALYYLRKSDSGSVVLTELTDGVLASTAGVPTEEVPDEEYVSLLHELHHVHLPKLAEAGVVDYYPERHLVGFAKYLPLLDIRLRYAERYERRAEDGS